jgi:dihydrofolate reductase
VPGPSRRFRAFVGFDNPQTFRRKMAKLRVHNFAVSLDGYGAGLDQSLEDPLGVGGSRLHEWVFQTSFGRSMLGLEGGESGVDNDYLAAGEAGIGATIMGRNMFGPLRGPWGDEDWRGWWGEEPPYHHPVFVLTHHRHDPIAMAGGTTFHFVTDGIRVALASAVEAADGKDVRLGGGVSTIRQYLEANLIDEMHVAVVPTLMGAGEQLLGSVDAVAAGYRCVGHHGSANVLHVHLARDPSS